MYENEAEGWLACERWLRGITRRLTAEPASADDLVQDVWVSALRHRPRAATARAWLRAVALNHLRDARRTDRRRAWREACVALVQPRVASPEDLVAHAQLARWLATRMATLKGHHRETLALRFFEEQSSAEIARTLRVPPGTVRRRLKEALDHLRAAFADDDRQARA